MLELGMRKLRIIFMILKMSNLKISFSILKEHGWMDNSK